MTFESKEAEKVVTPASSKPSPSSQWRIKNTFIDFDESPGKEMMRRRSTKTGVRRSAQQRISLSCLEDLLANPDTPSLASTSGRWSMAPIDPSVDRQFSADSFAARWSLDPPRELKRSSSPETESFPEEGSESENTSNASEEVTPAMEAEITESEFTLAAGRTTVMVRNLPNKYPQRKFLQVLLDKGIKNFDFCYLPMDFRNKCNVGYGFVNFGDSKSALQFMKLFGPDFKLPDTLSLKRIEVSWAKTQGFRKNVAAMSSHAVMKSGVPSEFKPIIFDLEIGQEIPFPSNKEGIKALKQMSSA